MQISKSQSKIQSLFKKLFIIALFAVVYFFGYLHGHGNLAFEKTLVPKLVNKELTKPAEVDFSLFWQAYDKIESEHVDKIDPQKALVGAIRGLVESLGDPFSTYLTKTESDSFLNDLNGKFEGIGAELEIENNILTVVTPLKDSPAQKAGLLPKDRIVAINGAATKDMNLNQAVSLIRGKSGTKVKLTIVSDQKPEPREIEIIRQAIKADSVSLSFEPDGAALLRITQFGDDTASLSEKYAKEIVQKNTQAMILDLRNNPGGLLDASVDVASLFLENKKVVVEKDRDNKEVVLNTTKPPILKDIALTVLINQGSASASEIVAGALKDYGRAKIIGEKSYGKGSVQDLIELDDQSTLRLTTAKWYTPLGSSISDAGIEPDIKAADNPDTSNDEAVDKAREVLVGSKQ